MTGSQSPKWEQKLQEQRNKNYEMFGGSCDACEVWYKINGETTTKNSKFAFAEYSYLSKHT